MEENSKKYGIQFLWGIEFTNGSPYVEPQIKKLRGKLQISKRKINLDCVLSFKESLENNSDLCIFVHEGPELFPPMFCFILDKTVPQKNGPLKKISLFISGKFSEEDFEDEDPKNLFLVLLYSRRNKKRLEKFGLEAESLEFLES